MFYRARIAFKATLCASAVALALAGALSTPFAAWAYDHYVSLSKIFPNGKCSAMALNFELLAAGFAGGELTEVKIHGDQGELVETITTFINKERDQWAIVGSKRDQKVIFCLYASGIGPDSIRRQTIR